MPAPKISTKILVDGGDPAETAEVKSILGVVDGQTTNPSLVAKNPEIVKMVAAGKKLTAEQANQEYKKIVGTISPLVGDAGVSIEVYSDLQTTAEQMFAEGKDKFSWIPNAYIKYPCTKEGLRAAEMSVREGIRLNITLVFSQQQAAAVYAATKDSKEPVYVSPFVGRLDDIGQNGMGLVANIKKMYSSGDGHVKVLVASVRNIEHLMYTFALGCELATVPTKVLKEWQSKGFPLPDASYKYDPKNLTEVPYEELDLNAPWESFDLKHELTDKGIERFVADYRATLAI